ncbi:hypothetical protein J2W51_000331 [Tardiphaga robiniae]|nr:hypothetical protein [Tardiphaga robiniae]
MAFRRYTQWHERGDPPLPTPAQPPKKTRTRPAPTPPPPGLWANAEIKALVSKAVDRDYSTERIQAYLKSKGYEVQPSDIMRIRRENRLAQK